MFDGAWGLFALFMTMSVFNTVLGEELLFRGLLLPRMHGAFGDRDWLANGLLFAVYHLHMPWVIPGSARPVHHSPGQAPPERLAQHRRPQRPERRDRPARPLVEAVPVEVGEAEHQRRGVPVEELADVEPEPAEPLRGRRGRRESPAGCRCRCPVGSSSPVATTAIDVSAPGGTSSIQRKPPPRSASKRVSKPEALEERLRAVLVGDRDRHRGHMGERRCVSHVR